MNLIFDIGANRGVFTQMISQVYPQADIVVVEANPNLHPHLVNLFSNNPKITVINNAVSDKTNDIIPFYLCSIDTISTAELDWVQNSRFKDYPYSLTPIKVNTVSLDYLIEQYGVPDLIKIDVEGYELQVIKGLSKKAKTICFEWAEEQYEKINQTAHHLESLGYNKFSYTIEDRYTEDLKYFNWKECPIHWDIDIHRKSKWGMIYVSE